MNQLEFKKHLKELVHGHHHPEEHDWGRQTDSGQPAPPTAANKRPAARKQSKTK